MEQDSIYLYDKQYRDLYLKSFVPKTCPETRKILSLMDRVQMDDALFFNHQHLENCQVCRDKYHALHQLLTQVNTLIPTIRPSKEALEKMRKERKKLESAPRREALKAILQTDIRTFVPAMVKSLRDPRMQALSFLLGAMWLAQFIRNW